MKEVNNMSNNSKYVEPIVEIIVFECEDILTDSTPFKEFDDQP